MKPNKSPLRTTILGGVVFLIPFALLLALGGKVFELMHGVSRPIAHAIGIERIGGIAVLQLVTVLLTAAICYAAGRVATSERGAALYRSIDERLIDLFPRYGFLKASASALSGDEATVLPVVMVRFDDQSQIGFEIERNDAEVVVFMPGSPDPWAGSVSFVSPDRVEPLRVDFNKAMKTLRVIGRGGLALR